MLAGPINRCGLFGDGCQNLNSCDLQVFLEERPRDADGHGENAYGSLRSDFSKTYGRRLKDAEGVVSCRASIHLSGLGCTVRSCGCLCDTVQMPGSR